MIRDEISRLSLASIVKEMVLGAFDVIFFVLLFKVPFSSVM